MISHKLLALLFAGWAISMQAQSGPCKESVVKRGDLAVAADVWAYMPPYGKPVFGKSELNAANAKSFSDRTNIKTAWSDDHRIVVTPSGEMAYEYGTVQIAYESSSNGHHEFKAVVLSVYKAKGRVCEKVALTMQPLKQY